MPVTRRERSRQAQRRAGAFSQENYTLPKPLAPFDDESMVGFMTRTAAAYRFHEPLRLFDRVHPSETKLTVLCRTDPASKLGRALQTFLGLNAATFRRLSLWSRDGTMASVLGQPIWSDLVHKGNRAVCPACLRDAAYHRAEWLINALPACTRHSAWLRSTCHRCRKPLGWSGMHVHACNNPQCAADLREADLEPVHTPGLAVVAELQGLLRRNEPGPLGMSPGETLKMTLVLARLQLGAKQGRKPSRFIAESGHGFLDVLASGWDALSDWPNGFHRYMDRLRAQASDRRQRNGLVKAFGRLPKVIASLPDLPWSHVIGEVFGNYAGTMPSIRTSRKVLQKYSPGTELNVPFMSSTEASLVLGVSAAAITDIARRHGLYAALPEGSGPAAALHADQVRKLKKAAKDYVYAKQAVRVLGVSLSMMEQLEKAGLIRRAPLNERVLEGQPYRRTELQAFIAACFGSAPTITVEEARAAGLTPLTRASAYRPVPSLCEALLTGRLEAAARIRGKTGLAGLRLRMSEVKQALPFALTTLGVGEAAALIGTAHHNVSVWIKRGFLNGQAPIGCRERGMRITRAAIEEFQRAYVTGGELPKAFGTTSKLMLAIGIEPVSEKRLDGVNEMLFRRSDLTEAVLAKMRALRAGLPGTPAERRLASLARSAEFGHSIGRRWGVGLVRDRIAFNDGRGRWLFVFVGFRPGIAGAFTFKVRPDRLAQMDRLVGATIALVPNVGDAFLLLPHTEVGWRRQADGGALLTVVFTDSGAIGDLERWSTVL